MYKLEHTIQNPKARSFLAAPNSEVIIKDENGLRLINSKSHFFQSSKSLEYIIFGDRLYVNDFHGNFAIHELKSKIQIDEGVGKAFFKVSTSVLGVEFIDKGVYHFGLMDSEYKMISQWALSKYNSVNVLVGDKWLLLKDLTTIMCVKTGGEKILWESNITDGIKAYTKDKQKDPIDIIQFSGHYGNSVLLTLNNGGILILNANDGNVLDYWPDAKLRFGLFPSEKVEPKFYGLNHCTYVKIDANNRALETQLNLTNKLQEISNNSMFIRASRLCNELFYFITDREFIGVFDVAKEEIVWYYELKFNIAGTFLRPEKPTIQLSGDKLYVMDSAGNLYVFKQL